MNQLSKLAACVAISIGIAGFTSASIAAATSATFNVTVTISQSCTVASQPLSSRNHNDLSAARLDVLVSTSPACPLLTAHAITRNSGNGIGATVANGQSTGPAGTASMDRFILMRHTHQSYVTAIAEPFTSSVWILGRHSQFRCKAGLQSNKALWLAVMRTCSQLRLPTDSARLATRETDCMRCPDAIKRVWSHETYLS